MARNKYPEETVNLILNVAVKLFLTKGYDNTSIQDIIDGLGGLSKGAIYHHFKSKESILIAVYEHMTLDMENEMIKLRDDSTLTGLERLQRMFMSSLKSTEHRELIASSPNLIDNPKLLAIQMKMTMEEVAPVYIEPVLLAGMADGSIKTTHPKELAEVLMLLSNIWMNPLVYPMSEEDISSKMSFFNELTTALGLSIIDSSLEEHLVEIHSLSKRKA